MINELTNQIFELNDENYLIRLKFLLLYTNYTALTLLLSTFGRH